jgi:holo-[acyl-carrier protein] synthase
MIFGIGTDIVSLSRIRTLHERYGVRFARRLLNESEMAEYAESRDPARFLAKRFAAKEAFTKALGTGFRGMAQLTRIYVAHDELGKPLLAFDKGLSGHVAALGIARAQLSISDEREFAVAFVILEKD